MYIDTIEISNFRSIGSSPPLKLDISDITVLSGINDTGKTSALLASFIGLNNVSTKNQGLYKLLDGSTHRKGYALDEAEQAIKPTFKCTEEDVEKVWEYIQNKEILKYILQELRKEEINIEEDTVKEFISEAVITLKIPLDSRRFSFYDSCVDLLLWNRYVENFFKYENLSELSAYLHRAINTAAALETSINNMNCLYVPGVTRSNDQILFREKDRKSQLIAFFKGICSEQGKTSGKYDAFKKYFKILLPELVRFEINIVQDNEESEDIFLTWNHNGCEKEQPLSRSGDGIYNTIFLMLKVLNNFNAMNIVFIDEPEIGLHPLLQQRFIKLLRKLSREYSIKWVLATHSPFILQSLKDTEKLYLMKHDDHQTNCQEIDIANKDVVFSTLGAYLPLALSATGVIFVEGQTEVTVLTILLDKVGLNIERERILIIPLGGENLFQIDAKDLKKVA